ncbi:GtrA family protein [Flavobacteriaceae bacterium]|nr:GtrA family protein [Flavobacteriaceae bacterium]
MSLIKKELKRFIVAGICAVCIDLLAYYLLLMVLTLNISKGISFLLGTVVAYIINKYWTFEKKEKSYREMSQFGILYSFTLGANVLANKIVLDLSNNTIILGFIVATGISTILNFVGQKWWVFR